ncbi:MAG: glycosyltransferase family 2 protein, partial [Catalinimonas sp.]
FVNYAQQRNWAQQNIPLDTEWVFHLDADERLTPELRTWLQREFPAQTAHHDGFLFPRRAVFMGRWIKYGAHYPNNYHARLYRVGMGHCEEKAYDQHFICTGRETIIYKRDIINVLTDSLDKFILSHNKWATQEAAGIMSRNDPGEVVAKWNGNPVQRRRWLKNQVFERTPLFARSFVYFGYRYFIRLGFLDGPEGLIFHFLQGCWFRFLVDAKVYEARQKEQLALPQAKEPALK